MVALLLMHCGCPHFRMRLAAELTSEWSQLVLSTLRQGIRCEWTPCCTESLARWKQVTETVSDANCKNLVPNRSQFPILHQSQAVIACCSLSWDARLIRCPSGEHRTSSVSCRKREYSTGVPAAVAATRKWPDPKKIPCRGPSDERRQWKGKITTEGIIKGILHGRVDCLTDEQINEWTKVCQ